MSAETISWYPPMCWLTGDFVRVDIDQLHHPIGVGAAGRGHQIHDGFAADLAQAPSSTSDMNDQNVRTARLFALIVYEPAGPRPRRVLAIG